MKKLFLSFLFLILNTFEVKAQLDTEHWFAPMINRHSGAAKQDNKQYLHLSTNETAPFDVEVYSGNKLVYTIKNLQKGSPKNQEIKEEYIVYRDENEAGKVINKGLYVKGPKKFYANLRIATRSNADIIISKGKAGIGNKFYAVTAPLSTESNRFNSMIGIIATKDNTTIKISNKKARFTGITTLKDIKLNKGESFILEADSHISNRTSVIGTKIESDEPISITNGNFYGNYNENTDLNILMDQSVPVNELGNEFAITKGKGNIGKETERVIIVATENNTQIYLNDKVNPIATINEGDYYMTPDTEFIQQKDGHYNLYIRTSKNAYAYHLFSGYPNSYAASGFGFIPPLNNALPNQIEEIGEIDIFNATGSDNNPNTPPTVNLNLITKKGADVSIAGYKLNGPFDLTGNNEWVTYSVTSNVKRNISIKSTQPIIAGIIGSKPGLGYGGYFTGSDNIITIKRNGECLPNVTLEVEEGLDSYQWLKNGIPIAGATSNTYKPAQAGNYSVKINNGKSTHTTTETRVENCLVETHIDDSICGVKSYIPKFSQSTQQIDLSSITIIGQPQYGSVSIDKGIITYTPDVYDGSDNFTYQFCGMDRDFPDCEIVSVNLTIGSIAVNNAELKTCKINDEGIFDLTSANIGDTTDYSVKYYPTLADAHNETNAITNPKNYTSKGGKVYAKAFSDTSCSAIVEINLEFHASPTINVNNYNATHCDNNFDGVVEINFAEVSSVISPNNDVKYYLNEADAKAGNNNFLPNQWLYSADTSVFVRAISNEGCHTIEQIDFKIKDRLALTQNQAEITLCDDDLDGIINVNLANYHSLFTQENVIGSYYATRNDAENTRNPLSVINAKNGETYYLRLKSSAHCANIVSLKFNINTPKKSDILTDQLICIDDTTILDAGAGFTSYLWSTGETTQNITAGVGTYWVKLISDNGCSYTQFVNVNAIETPKIISIDIKENVVSVNAEGGTQPYEYSLDGGRWQTPNVFTNVREGRHRVAVRSQNGCSPTEQDFSIIGLNNLITPNGDGINDTIDFSDLRTKANAKFNIYDRYGALVFEGNNSNQFIWDGKAKGRPLPTATYWYEIEWQEPNTNTWVKTASWILLKNRD